MKSLLAALGKEASKVIQRPAEPRVVMHAFCRAMTETTGRPIQLVFRAFPADIPVSGMRMDLGEQSIIVVEENMVPAHQLVILGHELWHEEQGDCRHHVAGMPAAARAHTDQASEVVRRAAEQILTTEEVPRDALLTVAARAESVEADEVEAETFGLLFGREVRTWMTGPYAQDPVNPTTVEGRLNLSLLGRGGRII
jgi:hypothetical protein